MQKAAEIMEGATKEVLRLLEIIKGNYVYRFTEGKIQENDEGTKYQWNIHSTTNHKEQKLPKFIYRIWMDAKESMGGGRLDDQFDVGDNTFTIRRDQYGKFYGFTVHELKILN